MLKNLLNKKEPTSKQTMLVKSLEGIGNILVFETKRQKNEMVLGGLEKISDLVKKIFEIQHDDPGRFEKLVFSQEFLNLHKQDEAEATFRLAFYPEKYSISLTTAVNQVIRVYEAAVDSKNGEISRFAVYCISRILAELASRQNNDLFVEQVLRMLAKIARTAVQHDSISAQDVAVRWYANIVFDRPGRRGDFQLCYLERFDQHFFSVVQYIIAERQTSVFQSLISFLVDGIHVPTHYRGAVRQYAHIILDKDLQKYRELDEEYQLSKRVNELSASENDLHTQEKLDAWLKKFEELKAIVKPHLEDEWQKKSAQKYEAEIIDFATPQFKYQNLLEIVFAVGAYCLFKERYDYIKYFWEYKQPPDADASWVGHDITPQTLDEAIRLYFRQDLFERELDFQEDHRGSRKYYKQYFLLLLARILQGASPNAEGKCPEIEDYILPKLHVYRLSNIEYSVDELVSLASGLKQAGDQLTKAGFDTARLDEIFDKKLVPFLNKLKQEASRQISERHKADNISQQKVQEFKKKILKTFDENACMRDIFTKHFSAYEDKTKEHAFDRKERFEINRIYDKAAFFDEWHVSYHGWGGNYGQGLASDENSHLFNQMAECCKEIHKENFESTLARFENSDDIVIFTTTMEFWWPFENSKKFELWQEGIKRLETQIFGGWYDFNGKLLPVFMIPIRRIDRSILIVNKAKVGKLIQWSPLNEGENEEAVEGIFYMDIQAFSENEQLMGEFLQQPLEWLKEIGNEQKQREYLRERVRIQIFEKFEYIKPDDFEGYKILFPKED